MTLKFSKDLFVYLEFFLVPTVILLIHDIQFLHAVHEHIDWYLSAPTAHSFQDGVVEEHVLGLRLNCVASLLAKLHDGVEWIYAFLVLRSLELDVDGDQRSGASHTSTNGGRGGREEGGREGGRGEGGVMHILSLYHMIQRYTPLNSVTLIPGAGTVRTLIRKALHEIGYFYTIAINFRT